MCVPRPEYPRPQLVRDDWIILNGKWQFAFDNDKTGERERWYDKPSFPLEITVPFCPESSLSGIQFTGFMPCVWYKRKLELPKEYAGKQIILHIGAADYHAVVYVNGKCVGEHKGGYTPFGFDITSFVNDEQNDITVCVYDDLLSHNQPSGKQSNKEKSYGCMYTRTTGIWQTVWIEAVSEKHINNINYTSDIENATVTIHVKVTSQCQGAYFVAKVFWNDKTVGEAKTKISSNCVNLTISLCEKHLWDLGKGNLYDVELEIDDGKICDVVSSYFGLRSVGLGKKAFYLNGRAVFGRWVLDQGYYPDGIYTAPNDEALKNDILKSMELGFNGARLHEKIFEPRFLYWADRLGYMVWGEHANWGLKIDKAEKIKHFLPEWLEAMERDMAHPSIIGWCPFNETGGFEGQKTQDDSVIEMTYLATKAADPTRPVIDTSGFCHVVTDIFDVHDYEGDSEKLKKMYDVLNEDIPCEQMVFGTASGRHTYRGEPVFVSEYGGIRWSPDSADGWGYGDIPKTENEFVDTYRAITDVFLNNPSIMGFCYTQLYDVEQEKNGLITYEREFKFDPKIFYEINTRTAEIEKE